jgi:hypothetical protein
MTDRLITEKADNEIDKFKKTFYNKFGVYPYVTYSFDNINEMSPSELLKLINEDLENTYPNTFKKGIFTKTRKKEIVLRRQIFCRITTDMGLSSSQIGKFLNIDHSTVIYSKRVVAEMLLIKDPIITNLYWHIINMAKTKIKNDKAL